MIVKEVKYQVSGCVLKVDSYVEYERKQVIVFCLRTQKKELPFKIANPGGREGWVGRNNDQVIFLLF